MVERPTKCWFTVHCEGVQLSALAITGIPCNSEGLVLSLRCC